MGGQGSGRLTKAEAYLKKITPMAIIIAIGVYGIKSPDLLIENTSPPVSASESGL